MIDIDGHLDSLSLFFVIAELVNWVAGKPCSAYSIAGPNTRSNSMEP